jgi:NAD(P)-dependent dehydrogenase (short-subunit alcohol dehydrogenase family)
MVATFHNKVALVTGGGRGIGRGIALALAKYGAKVAVMARSSEEVEQVADEIRTMGGTALACSGDVSNYADVQRITTEVANTLGAVDILVNNAAVVYAGHFIEESNPEAWVMCQQINLIGAYYLIHATLPAMKQRGYGRIINVTSGAAYGIPRGAAYSVSKAALNTLSQTVAAETTNTGVCVVAVNPGEVDTMMQFQLRGMSEAQLGERLYKHFHSLKDEGRLTDPLYVGEQIAAIVMTDKTGEILVVPDPDVADELAAILVQAKTK